MAQVDDFKDFVIRSKSHQKYSTKIIEDDLVEVIIQKLEMVLFTNKQDVLGQEGFDMGVNLEFYLWQTKVSNDILKDKIIQQINRFIPELNVIGYTLDLKMYEGTVQDILHLNFVINAYNITFIFE